MTVQALKLGIPVGNGRVSGLFLRPDDASALYLFAHGAGVGMAHPSMDANARGLAARGIATMRFQFPYMERGSGRPDPPPVAHAAIRFAAGAAANLAPDLPLFAGGRSYGGRMTSLAQSIEPIAGARGLVFLGFPLHPPGAPAADRADHLAKVEVPMLFISGDRDALADLEMLKTVVDGLGDRATLHTVSGGDHGLRVLKSSGRTPADAQNEALDAAAEWIKGHA
jgi:hypothetical protein